MVAPSVRIANAMYVAVARVSAGEACAYVPAPLRRHPGPPNSGGAAVASATVGVFSGLSGVRLGLDCSCE